jgi:hypothetical protein
MFEKGAKLISLSTGLITIALKTYLYPLLAKKEANRVFRAFTVSPVVSLEDEIVFGGVNLTHLTNAPYTKRLANCQFKFSFISTQP